MGTEDDESVVERARAGQRVERVREQRAAAKLRELLW
jgi:hypothetical protein